jgi:hypothetical protein
LLFHSQNFDQGLGRKIKRCPDPHDPRRYSATYASRNGVPSEIVSKVILRHQDLKTTQAYLGKVTESEAILWMDVLHGERGDALKLFNFQEEGLLNWMAQRNLELTPGSARRYDFFEIKKRERKSYFSLAPFEATGNSEKVMQEEGAKA